MDVNVNNSPVIAIGFVELNAVVGIPVTGVSNGRGGKADLIL